MIPILKIDCLVCKESATPEFPAAEAAMIARVKGGCHVVGNIIQPLCEQHWESCEPLEKGGAEVIIELGQEQHDPKD